MAITRMGTSSAPAQTVPNSMMPTASVTPRAVTSDEVQAPQYVLQRYRGPAEFSGEPATPPRDVWRISTYVGTDEYGLEAEVTDAQRATAIEYGGAGQQTDALNETTEAIDRDTMKILLDLMNQNADKYHKHPRLTTRVRL
jgi:hypothetical protein